MAADEHTLASPWEVEHWLSDGQATAVEYSEYWNDEQAERDKPFHVVDNDFSKLERYLAEVGLPADRRSCLETLPAPLAGRGIDVAAGTLWAVPMLLDAGPVQRLYCLEYSKHRLLTLGPRALDHDGVDPGEWCWPTGASTSSSSSRGRSTSRSCRRPFTTPTGRRRCSPSCAECCGRMGS